MGVIYIPGKIPNDIYINIDTIAQQIDLCIDDFAVVNNLDFTDRKTVKSLSHLEVMELLRYIYNHLFKPDRSLCNNQKSIIDYNNNELMGVLVDKFIDICLRFNVSLGVPGFCIFTGINQVTVWRWLEKGEEANPIRCNYIKYIRAYEQDSHEALLKQDPMGRVALANHSKKLGLNWEEQNRQQITNNQIYLLSSERAGALGLGQLETAKTKALPAGDDV